MPSITELVRSVPGLSRFSDYGIGGENVFIGRVDQITASTPEGTARYLTKLREGITPSTASAVAPVATALNVNLSLLNRARMSIERNGQQVDKHPVAEVFDDLRKRHALGWWFMLNGNSYAWMRYEGGKLAIDIIRSYARVKIDNGQYTFSSARIGAETRTFRSVSKPEKEVLHVAGESEDGVFGVSPVAQIADLIGFYRMAIAYAGGWFTTGGSPRAIFFPDQDVPLSAQEFKQFGDALLGLTGVPGGSERRLIVSPTRMGKVDMQTSPNESQFLETLLHLAARIMARWGVPPLYIGDTSRTSYANALMMRSMIVSRFIQPFTEALSDSIRRMGALAPNEEIKWDLSMVERGTPDELARILTAASGPGWMPRRFAQDVWGIPESYILDNDDEDGDDSPNGDDDDEADNR